jgi:serine/threonine-protein kinase
MSGARRISWALAGQLLVALPANGAPSATEKAAAEALFQEGTALMADQKYDAACAKFEASQAIESGLGIKLWLADCYDRQGRTASAWALFTEAAALAHQSSQAERERAANERAADLERRLSKLELKSPAAGLPKDVVVSLNGVAIPDASLGSALPVDPGKQRVVFRAPGYRTLTLDAEVPPGPSTIGLEIPALEREPDAPRQAAADPADAARHHEPKPGATQRTLGWALGGLGVLSFAGSGLLALRAHSLDQQSHQHCLVDEPNACDPEGASLRGQATTYGNVATGAFVAGTALTATGVVLLLTAPSSSKKEVRVGTRPLPGGAALVVTGRL